jgi:hypothetical protein
MLCSIFQLRLQWTVEIIFLAMEGGGLGWTLRKFSTAQMNDEGCKTILYRPVGSTGGFYIPTGFSLLLTNCGWSSTGHEESFSQAVFSTELRLGRNSCYLSVSVQFRRYLSER